MIGLILDGIELVLALRFLKSKILKIYMKNSFYTKMKLFPCIEQSQCLLISVISHNTTPLPRRTFSI